MHLFFRKQKMEKEGHRRINCGRFPNAIQDKARPADSILRKLWTLALWVLGLRGPSPWGLLMVDASLPSASPNGIALDYSVECYIFFCTM